MFKNYLKIAIRNLLKDKSFMLINLIGLSLGITCCILIFLFVQQELSHEDFHKKADRIFRIVNRIMGVDEQIRFSSLQPYKLASSFQEEFPSIVRSSGYMDTDIWIQHGEKIIKENVGFVDQTFLEMFSFPLLAGDPEKALQEPYNVVITEDVARKFFGNLENNNIPGKVLLFPKGKQKEFIITGILKSIPETSSIKFDIKDL